MPQVTLTEELAVLEGELTRLLMGENVVSTPDERKIELLLSALRNVSFHIPPSHDRVAVNRFLNAFYRMQEQEMK
jgi:hypothetical protein